ncbi:MAG: serpin [Nocardioidaceae bacterium]|nr:serpin [Nocardioidaceae bacterium]
MLSRRELLRAGTLGGLVVAAPGVFVGCSDGGGPKPKPGDNGIRLVSSDVARDAADPAVIGAGAESVLALGAGLYGQLVGGTGNLAVSPYSAAVALAMTVNGAVGATRDEMLAVLAAADTASLDDGLNALTSYVESLAGPVPHVKDAEIALASANQLFGQAGFDWQKPFLDALARSFGAGLREVDYEGAADAARAAVNGWTADQTHDRIPEIIPSGAIDATTRLVLVNALYFKAPWAVPFEPDATTDDEFHLGDGSTVSVPTMHGGAGYGEGDGWRAAHLTYAGDTLAMTVVLPDEGREDDLDALVAGGGLDSLLEVQGSEVDLSLPRWKFLVGESLNDALNGLGMTTAFDAQAADFSAMTTDDQLVVGNVLQQVFIAVDEAGTEAAAATAVVMDVTSAPAEPPEPLVVDRPFLFVIHDVQHGTPLFLGKVVDPRS